MIDSISILLTSFCRNGKRRYGRRGVNCRCIVRMGVIGVSFAYASL